MSQTYTDDCFAGGHVAQTDMTNIEANFAALKSAFSGTSTPSNTVAGMWWFDTTANILKLRNEANSAWLDIYDFANEKVPDDAVDTDQIVDDAVTTAKIDALAVGTTEIAAGAVTSEKIADDAVDSDQIVDDAITLAHIADDAIGLDQLKMTLGTVSTTSNVDVDLTLPGGAYGFCPQLSSNLSSFSTMDVRSYTNNATGYVSEVSVKAGNSSTATVRQYYIQSSPPYKIGDQTWGHFLFILRNKADQKIIGTYEAPDPPWAYNGSPWNVKDSKERIQEVPHPFCQYHHEDLPSDLEIVMVDLRETDVDKIKSDAMKAKKDYVNEIFKLNPAGKTRLHIDFSLPEIIGFTDKIKIKGVI